MFKVWNVVLRNRRVPEGKSLCISAQRELIDAVKKHFNIVVENNKSFKRLTKSISLLPYQIENNCKKILKYNVHPKPSLHLIRCIMYRSYLLEHRVHLLQELGVNDITLKDLCSLPFYMEYNEAVSKSSKTSKWPIQLSTVKNTLKSIGCWPTDMSEDLPNDSTLEEIYKSCMSYHLRKNLQLPNEMFMTSVILDKKYRFYSFRMIQETLEILTNVLGLDVLQCPEALLADPNEIYSLIHCLKEIKILGLSPKEVIRQKPEILFLSAENIRNIMDVLRSYGISEEEILENIKIFRDLDKDECIRRVKMLKEMSEVWIYRQHPVFLFIICNFRTSLSKLEYSKILRKGETPIQFVKRSKAYIQRNQFSKYMKFQIRSNIYYILEPELMEHTETALANINEHPNFDHAKPMTVKDTVTYLKEQFPIDVIARNGQVLLYQRDVLAKALDIVRAEYSTKNGYDFSLDHQLQLAQYLLERNIGFSGDSIWYTEFPNGEDIPHLPPRYR